MADSSEYENCGALSKMLRSGADTASPQLPPRPPKTGRAPQATSPTSAGGGGSTLWQGETYDDIYEPVEPRENDDDNDNSSSEGDVYEPVEDVHQGRKPAKKPTKEKGDKKGGKPRPQQSKSPPIALTSELEQVLKVRKHSVESGGGKRTPERELSRACGTKSQAGDEPKVKPLPFKVNLRPVNTQNTPKPSTPPSDKKAAIVPQRPSQTASKRDVPASPAAEETKKGVKPQPVTPKPATTLKPSGTKPAAGKTASLAQAGAATTAPKTPPKSPAIHGQHSFLPKKTGQSHVSATGYINQKEMAVVGPTSRQKTPPSPGNSQSSSPRQSSPTTSSLQNESSAHKDEFPSRPSLKKPGSAHKEEFTPLPLLQKQGSAHKDEFQPRPSLQKQGSAHKEGLKPLRDMTIADVQALLTRLNMSDFQDKFEKKQVDGPLLAKLDEEALREDFNMSKTDRIKLMNFVSEGHLPVYESWSVQ